MKKAQNPHADRLALRAGVLVLLLGTSIACGNVAAAENPIAGTSVGPPASMLRRPAPGQPWHVVMKDEKIPAGELIVAGPDSSILSKDGKVRLNMLTDFGGNSPFPVIEAAVSLRETPDADLGFVLDRGRVDVTNTSAQGPAKVRFQVRQDTWELTLAKPGDRVALELYGRWPAGAQVNLAPGAKDTPLASLVILALKGDASLLHKGAVVAMQAPPGPALIEWDSVNGQDSAPSQLDKLPTWATEDIQQSPEARARAAVRVRFRELLLAKGLTGALDTLLASNNPLERRLGVMCAAATDELERLALVWREGKHPDVYLNGIQALRHWIGRGPGQDQALYTVLLEKGHLNPVQAETILQLLHSFGDDELKRPEIYQTLISFLNHDVPAIRGLAYWHLVRLAPSGKEFGYDPFAEKSARAAAIAKWKKLIPPGKLPPPPKVG